MENGEIEEDDQEGELRERQQYEFQVWLQWFIFSTEKFVTKKKHVFSFDKCTAYFRYIFSWGKEKKD
jgi:hypothetical protein